MYKSTFKGLEVDKLLSKIKDPIIIDISKNETFKLVKHGMNKYPVLKLINSSGEEVFCNKTYKDNNTIIVNWKIPFDGFLVIGE